MNKSLSITFSCAALLAMTLAGCSSSASSSPSGLPMTSMQIGNKIYQLEIAADDQSREHGLMERDNLPSDHGMIFVFTTTEPQNFWMHNTRFPLDIIFADDHEKIVSIHTMKAYDETNTPSNGPAKYAIELNAGETTTDGIKPGDQLHIPPTITPKK